MHKEKRIIKSEKWVPRLLKEILVGYNGHIIYWVHIKDHNKVIEIKNLQILKNYKTNVLTKILDYDENKLTF